MKYAISILRTAQKELARLSGNEYKRIKETVEKLGEEPRPSGCRKLVSREGWRIRTGDYRIIYEIDDREKMVIVFHIGHRRDVYH